VRGCWSVGCLCELVAEYAPLNNWNHGFAVDDKSLGDDIKVTHINLNDNTVEGIQLLSSPAFSVQYHPEASPGPHDAQYLFERFIELMDEHRKGGTNA